MSTKDRIILAAKELFSTKGYHETKVSDIAEKAGVAQGTFYLYFKSKEDLFLELIKTLHRRLMEDLEKYYHKEDSFEVKIKNLLEDFIKEIYNNKEIAIIFFHYLLGINEEFKNIYVQKISDLQKLLAKIIEKDLPSQDSFVASNLIIGYIRQLIFNCLLIKNESLERLKERLDQGLNIIFKGIK